MMGWPSIPRISNHGSEILLLATMAIGVMILIGMAIEGKLLDGKFDVAACLLILQRIVEAVQKRWEQRGQDAKEMQLAAAPAVDVASSNLAQEPDATSKPPKGKPPPQRGG